MIISPNTKIAAIIKQNPEALEAIVSISKKFEKLRNPLLRKMIGRRTSIAMASKLGDCSVDDFFNKLQPLGFEIDRVDYGVSQEEENNTVPAFMKIVDIENIIELDVRPVFETGKDPLQIILQKVKTLKSGDILKIINSFEPTPLMHLLSKQGFESYAEVINKDLVNTYFYKKTDSPSLKTAITANSSDWDEVLKRYDGKLRTIDVRAMEMPLPMHTILESLNSLPEDQALFVYHKRIPVFLLPELEDQHFSYRIKEISDGEVHLLIYKD
ncbi:MAG: DUF2249 domain-containing protein [Chitinophagaceae bacterium]